MKSGDKAMGRFAIEFEIANDGDLDKAGEGQLDPAKVRRAIMSGVADSGATHLILPQAVVKRLGLPVQKNKVEVRYADGRVAQRTKVDKVRVYLQGRNGVFSALVEPNRKSALIGAIIMEDLDFLVDCKGKRLIPRNPDRETSEIE